MSKEIADIIGAFDNAMAAGRRTALATVVRVDGSSYRRPGARMLVEDNGQLTGAISGGCLEGDALRKAQLAIHRQENSLVIYDTTDEDDLQFGVKLGCNGIVYILFEPIDPNQSNHPIALLRQVMAKRRAAVVATIYATESSASEQPGTCTFSDGETIVAQVPGEMERDALLALLSGSLERKQTMIHSYENNRWSVLVEYIPPPVTLVLIGAGNDAIPMAAMAHILGWETIVADGRDTHATKERFPTARQVIMAKPEALEAKIQLDEHCCVLLMTHNYNFDLAVMRWLLHKDCFYIGTLGPKKRLLRILQELSDEGVEITETMRSGIYGPTGLDIGAETAEEIALSVLAEIKAVHEKRSAGFLKNRPQAIHDREEKDFLTTAG